MEVPARDPQEPPGRSVDRDDQDRKTWADRQHALAELQGMRSKRLAVSLFNLDRQSIPPIQGLSTQFSADMKEPLFRVLKESFDAGDYEGIDLCLYTRGGDTNAVWPIANLLREFDKEFQVLVPFRCHSSGTLLALAGKSIVMGPLSELSPIDPTCGNQFNPTDPLDQNSKLGISVEDVQSYRDFLLDQLHIPVGENEDDGRPEGWRSLVVPLVSKMAEQVHPLALGNVHRVVRQIRQLAERLLAFHSRPDEDAEKVIEALTTRFFSHTHMLDRNEAKELLGERVEFADPMLSAALDRVLKSYKQSFRTWEPFHWSERLGDNITETFDFVGGVVETRHWSYLYRTKVRMSQSSVIPEGVQINVPAGQPVPIVQGLPRSRSIDIIAQGWTRNERQTGVTV